MFPWDFEGCCVRTVLRCCVATVRFVTTCRHDMTPTILPVGSWPSSFVITIGEGQDQTQSPILAGFQ